MPSDDDMSIEQLVASLEGDSSWSDEALADRSGATEMLTPTVVNWRTISDHDRTDACAALADWVQNWLVPRYAVPRRLIPDCWYEHSAMVEELSAIHVAWLVAFDEADSGFGPIGWHERYALACTREAFKEKCSEGHREIPARSMPTVPGTF